MKSTAHEQMLKGFRRMADQERKNSVRSVITRGRHLDNSIDWGQLPVRESEPIHNDEGLFYFIPGFSIVGDGDVVRP